MKAQEEAKEAMLLVGVINSRICTPRASRIWIAPADKMQRPKQLKALAEKVVQAKRLRVEASRKRVVQTKRLRVEASRKRVADERFRVEASRTVSQTSWIPPYQARL